jgi:hypothetical protein
MTLMRDDHVDIGVLLAWALRPNQRPGRSPEYQRVLDRYRTVAEFRAAADAVPHGLGATVLSDGDFGLVLGVAPEHLPVRPRPRGCTHPRAALRLRQRRHAWLPPALRPRAGELLASGEKVAQEHLGLQALLANPTLIAGLAS